TSYLRRSPKRSHTLCPWLQCGESETRTHALWDCGQVWQVWHLVTRLYRKIDLRMVLTYDKVLRGWNLGSFQEVSLSPRGCCTLLSTKQLFYLAYW
uniref:Uncharacterized protein n=1 Tax=Scleropages formosus TaxID=113540 RepID=A0A8C9S3B0_SCLFO